MRQSHQVVFASMNPDKFREFASLLATTAPEVKLVPAEGLLRNPEKLGLAEVHATYLENSAAKARLANQGSHYPALADDTGLEVDALEKKPGVRSHRYAKVPTQPGQFIPLLAQDEANRSLLLSELKKIPNAPRTARFVTSLALVIEGVLIHAQGTLEGAIADEPRGSNGFGYDSIFIPQGSSKTLAEMTENEKNTISHRARAIQDLVNQMKMRGIVLAKP